MSAEEIVTSESSGSVLGLKQVPWWIRMVPFFLSALLFLSAFFSIFAPIPLLFTRYRFGRRSAWLASISNSVIVFAAAGGLSLAVYAVFILTLAMLMPEMIRPRWSLGRIGLSTLLGMALAALITVLIYSAAVGVNPWAEFKSQVSSTVDFLTTSLPPASMPAGDVEKVEWKRQIVAEFPSVIIVFAMLMVWVNLMVLLRANPGGVREKAGLSADFAREWRAPEALLWITIASGGLIVWDMYYPLSVLARDIALNVFRVMMAIYAIQGLSILAYFFESWNVRGFLRVAGMMAAVFLMMPLLLSLGFFDQLFDFRSRIRQS